MTAHRHNRSRSHASRPIVAALLAALSLISVLAPPASAQGVPDDFLATQFFAAIGDEAAAYQLSADAVLHTPEGDFSGRAGLVQFGDGLEASFSDLAFSTQYATQAGDLLMISLTITGINTDSYRGVEANCAGIAIPAVAMLRVTEQSVVSEAWKSTPPELRYHVSQMEQVTMVVEQWIDYDADAIARQIAAINELDASVRPDCADYFLPQEAGDFDGPPVPTSPHDSRSPY
jgi:SnoaL-like polyketide cyclase